MSLSPTLLVVLLMLALGKLFARARLAPDNTPEVLNGLILKIFLPALVLKAVRGLSWQPDLLALVLTPWLLLGLSWAAILLGARMLRLDRASTGCLLLCASLGNTAFLGYPLIEASLGRAALPYAVVYDQLGSFLILSSFGLAVVALYGGGERVAWRTVALKILRFPAFIALLIGLLPIPHPSPFDQAVDLLAAMLVPLAMFAVGFQFKLVPPAGQGRALLLGLGTKMLMLPLCAWALLSAYSDNDLLIASGTLQAAMSPMITAGALAMSARLAPALAASMVGYGLLLALLLVPLLAPWLI